MLKCINHARKIAKLSQPYEPWLQKVFELFGLKDFYITEEGYINHVLFSEFC